MKKTLFVMTLCAITALFSGCWKKKDNAEGTSTAPSTNAPVMTDEKTIKVASLDTGLSALSNNGKNDNEPKGEIDEAKGGEMKDDAKDEDLKEKAEEMKGEAKELKDEAADLEEKAEELKDEADTVKDTANEIEAEIKAEMKANKKNDKKKK
jgi:hypothetical protein